MAAELRLYGSTNAQSCPAFDRFFKRVVGSLISF
ncbi:MAG: hypothetical protein JWL90_336 [Chthoniobacteraceae bacterium]|nr:hypothetical protein [Chthoniobacteraceae bacterium]